jgi:hypothetical protein
LRRKAGVGTPPPSTWCRWLVFSLNDHRTEAVSLPPRIGTTERPVLI